MISERMKIRTLEYALQEYWIGMVKENNITDSRERNNVRVRHAFAVAVKTTCKLSLKTIGTMIGRDHATVLHAMKQHSSNMKFDSVYRAVYKMIETDVSEITEKDFMEYLVQDDMNFDDSERQLRVRCLSLSRRLRNLKSDFNQLCKEHKVVARHNRKLQDRNTKLNAELMRVKNLL